MWEKWRIYSLSIILGCVILWFSLVDAVLYFVLVEVVVEIENVSRCLVIIVKCWIDEFLWQPKHTTWSVLRWNKTCVLFQGLVAWWRHRPAAVVSRDHSVGSYIVYAVGPPRCLLGWPDTCRKRFLRKYSKTISTLELPTRISTSWAGVSFECANSSDCWVARSVFAWSVNSTEFPDSIFDPQGLPINWRHHWQSITNTPLY